MMIMSKAFLTHICDASTAEKYVWALYFYKIDRRSNEQPYKFYKIRFKNDLYLLEYANSLMSSVSKFQISPIESVQDYDGENTKVSCDKLALNDDLISLQWTNFIRALSRASDDKVTGKINGYVLYGIHKDDANKLITFIKTANPITNLTNKKTVVFTTTAENSLDMVSDTVCRLYLTTDIIVVNETMYTYNHNFEALFDIMKTMTKVKNTAIDAIVATNAFSDKDAFKTYASQYTSNRTFITLKLDRLERIKDKLKRKDVASMLGISLDDCGNFIIDTKEKAAHLIKYLCFKIFKDGETNNVLEASTISPLTIK